MSSPLPPAPPRSRPRGSVLITALILSAIIAISLTSYIKIALNSLTLADRSFYQNAAVNLSEVGIESAMYCYNRLDEVSDPRNAWGSLWTIAGDNSVTATLRDFNLGPGVSGEIKVYCSSHTGSGTTPVVVAKSIVTFRRGGGQIVKFMEVTLRRRSLFANGLVARNAITWSGGNVSVDSWISDPDNDSATGPVAYSTSVQRANGTVGSINTANGAIDLGNGNVYGYVSSGGGSISYGPTAIVSGTFPGSGVDTGRLSRDFSASFPTVALPSPSFTNLITTSITGTTSLPAGSHTAASDGSYYYSFASGTNIDLNGGGKNLQITDKVVLLFNNHSGVTSFALGGNAYMNVATTGKVKIYTNGNLDMTGNGVANANNDPASCQIFGTNSTSQTLAISGNGQLKAAVYAPNGSVTMNGGGSSGNIMGSIVANSISMTGGSAFHYDESLSRLGAGNPFGIVKWRELQSAEERATLYPTQLNF